MKNECQLEDLFNSEEEDAGNLEADLDQSSFSEVSSRLKRRGNHSRQDSNASNKKNLIKSK
jgi:hypothetical protein